MDLLDARKEQILALLVREYVRTAEPVGSKQLEEACGFSAATIRNEMVALTDMGYLTQPHTSAGRVPTEAAYRYYIEHSLSEAKPDLRDFKAVMDERETEMEKLRHMARLLAQKAGGSVFVSTPDDIYLTGLSFLFGQPEFHSPEFVQDVSHALDTLEEHMTELMKRLPASQGESPDPVTVLVGSENPFHDNCATMMLRTPSGEVVIGVLGPLRMDYDRVMPLLNGIRQLMQE